MRLDIPTEPGLRGLTGSALSRAGTPSSPAIHKRHPNCYSDQMEPKRLRLPAALFRTTVVLLWLALFALLLRRDYFIDTIDMQESTAIAQAQREEYQGIYFHERKIGFVASTFEPREDGSFTLDQRARMTLNVAGGKHTIDMRLTAVVTADSRLRDFDMAFHSPYYQMRADGRADGSSVSFRLETASATITDTVRLPAPPMLSTSRRAYLLKQGIEEGKKVRIPWFDPLSLTGKDSVIEYRGRDKELIHGRVQNLHLFVENVAGARVSSWLDDNGDVLKEESPAGFVFLKEPKFKALADNDEIPELLAAVAAKLIGTMPDLDGLRQMRYRLQFPDDGGFRLHSGRQRYAGGILTIDRESLPPAPGAPAACRPEAADLAATRMVQAGHPKITALAAEIAGGIPSPSKKLRAIAAWVYGNLEKRPVLGLPDALTVLDSRIGDCNEHAVLFAALARAAGIPCRIAAGVTYLRGAFYYHAWNEACIDGHWISVDTTTNQLPADLGHIKFVEGEFRDQVRIGALLGQLSIEPLPPAEGTAADHPQPQEKP